MKSLQDGVSRYLNSNIHNFSLKDIFKVLYLSHKLQKTELKQNCIMYIRRQMKIITQTAEWSYLLNNKPELATEIIDF